MKKLLTSAMLLIGLGSTAQQDILVSQYMFNHLLLNPAYSGSKDYMMATLLYRKQWVDFSGAPETQVASLHGPLGLTQLGWGGLISHDKIGVTDRTDVYANAAYHLKLNQKMKLSLGLRGGGGIYSYKNSDLKVWDANDPAFAGDKVSRFLPNVGAGAYLYGERFYAGVSVPTIISYDPVKSLSVNLSGGDVIPHQVRHYFATAGAVFELHPDVMMKPSVLVKYVDAAPVEADFNVNFLFANTLWLGGSYRTGDSFVALLEIQLTKKLRLGYSYDFTFTDIKDYSSGSHEIMLGYDFGFDIMKMRTPRYF
ncbi:MAG: type IX secretion system membrane protein PorP/SprF [Bacteroidetes bacterium]|nr:MAG: type IX secretion system membrane protein PorP/SprF [Bacteroidota bacterium]